MTRRILTSVVFVALLGAGCEPSSEEKLFREMGLDGYCTMRVHSAVQASLQPADELDDNLVADDLFSETQLLDLLGEPDAILSWEEWLNVLSNIPRRLGPRTQTSPGNLVEWNGGQLVPGPGGRHLFTEPVLHDARILLYRWDEPVEHTGSDVGGTIIFVTVKKIVFKHCYYFGVAESKVIHAGILEWMGNKGRE